MSRVTNVMISVDYEDDATMRARFASGAKHAWAGWFTEITSAAADPFWICTGKRPECSVWAGAFNHLNRGALFADIESAPWLAPECVQVFMLDDDDRTFGVWMLRDGRLVQLLAPVSW